MVDTPLAYAEILEDIDQYLAQQSKISDLELYQLWQPTGLLYSRSLQTPKYLSINQTEVSLKSLLLSAYVLVGKNLGETNNELHNILVEYFKLFHNLRDENKTDEIDNLFEQYVLKHTLDKTDDEIRISLNQVFFDLLFFKAWLESDKSLSFDDYDHMLASTLDISLALYKVDGLDQSEIAYSETQIDLYNLLDQTKTRLKQTIQSDDTTTDFSLFDSYLAKRYLLEQTIIASWTDGEVSDLEVQFFTNMAKKLGLPEDKCNESQMAVECFILNNLHQLPEIKASEKEVSGKLQKRVAKFFDRNKKAIIQEINESKELVQLIGKSTTQKLTEEEKRKVKEQTLDILKMIPSFAIFILPFGSLILPLILKIVPDHILKPSAYLEQDN